MKHRVFFSLLMVWQIMALVWQLSNMSVLISLISLTLIRDKCFTRREQILLFFALTFHLTWINEKYVYSFFWLLLNKSSIFKRKVWVFLLSWHWRLKYFSWRWFLRQSISSWYMENIPSSQLYPSTTINYHSSFETWCLITDNGLSQRKENNQTR